MIFRQSPISLKLIEFFIQNKTHWSYVEFFRKFNSKSIHVFPKQVFASKLRRAWKMISLLILVEVLNIWWHDIPSPLKIEHIIVRSFNHYKASIFATVNNCVVNVCIIKNLERHKQVFDFFSFVFPNSITFSLNLTVTWVLKKCSGRSIFENWLEKSHFIWVRFKYTVRQSSFFPFNKSHINWVCL